MRGKSDKLAEIAEQILAIRGVKHGGIEIIPDVAATDDHGHAHAHGHGHPHRHPHPHR